MAYLELCFLGALQVRLDGKMVALRSGRVQNLLAYLALEAGQPQSRLTLAALFWPDESAAAAKQNLRQALYQLRQLLATPQPLLLIERETVQFNPAGDYTLDVTTFLAHLAQQQWAAAVELYQGELLAGLSTNSAHFEEWLLLRREQLQIQALAALDHLTQQALLAHNDTQAQHYAHRQLALEPWREMAHRQLMLALARSGERNAALAQYDRCCRLLADELGVEPDRATQALVAQIRSGSFDLGRAGDKESGRQGERESGESGAEALLLSAPPVAFAPVQDWGDAPDVSDFYGRASELRQLHNWLIDQHCRVIALLGMGGMGKTTLAVHVARQCTTAAVGHFAFVIWRSLLNAPTLPDLVGEWLQVLAAPQLAQLPTGLDAQLNLLFATLRQQRCLLVLDNAESILQGGERAGYYRAGYEAYGQLLLRMGQSNHQSCLLLTSREQPRELARLAAETPFVRTLLLDGLDAAMGHQLLRAQGLVEPDGSTATLVTRYSGNPLALKLVADTIQDLFGGDVGAFLRDDALIFDDIRDVLDQQFARLAPLEQDLLLWLAIEREPVTEANLWQPFAHTTAKRSFLEALRSLQRRTLLEQYNGAFGLQNVVTEYLTDYLVTQVYMEVAQATPRLLHSHALIRASAKEYVRQSQQRIILQPLGERLLGRFGRELLAAKGKALLATAQREAPLRPNFLAGNWLNLCLYLGIDVAGYDFSDLTVWQAYLRGADLPLVNFSRADLTGSVFTDYNGAVTAVAISPDGQLLAAGMDNGLIYLWQLATLTLIGVCQGHASQIGALAFAPAFPTDQGVSGHRLASASDDQTVRIWDVDTRQPLQILVGHQGAVRDVAFHPSGRVVASGSTDRRACIWDVATGACLHTLHGHRATVTTVAFAPPDSSPAVASILATGSHDQTVRLWDWQHETTLQLLHGHTGSVVTVAFSPQPIVWGEVAHPLLVSGSFDQTLRVWALPLGEPLSCLTGHSAPVISAVFSADGVLLISGSDDQSVRVWMMAGHGAGHGVGQGQTVRILHGHYGVVNALAIHPQHSLPQHQTTDIGGELGTGVSLVSGSYDKTLRLWDLHTGQTLAILRGHSKWIQALVFTPQGELLVSGSDGQNVRVWDGYTGRTLHTLRGHTSLTEKLAFRADGTQLASASWDKSVRIWDLRQPRDTQNAPPAQLLHGHTGPVMVVVNGPGPHGHSLVASGGLDQTVRLWDGERGQALAVCHGHRDRVVALALRPDGQMVASGALDHLIGLWDTQSGELICFLHGHTAPVECVAFHPAGNWLASGSWDRSVCIWDIQTGAAIHTLRQHTNGLEMVRFSPDGSLLASCGCDHLICVWDVQEGRLLYTLSGHRSWVRCLAFGDLPSAAGRLLASGSNDGTVKLWDLTAAGAGACRRTIAMEDPYTAMQIRGITGISDAQKAALKALGAVER